MGERKPIRKGGQVLEGFVEKWGPSVPIVDVREHTPDGTKPSPSRPRVTTPAPDAVLLKPLAARVYMADIVAITVVLVMGAV